MALSEFLDVCKNLTQTNSDSNLARKVEITRAAIAAYRKGSSFPSDENMVKLAIRAKLDVGECLLLLNMWRTKGQTSAYYREILISQFPESDFL